MSFEQIKMTPADFRSARLALGLTKKELSRELNTTYETIAKWEKDGGYGPHPTAVIAMIWFKEGFRPAGTMLPTADVSADDP